MTNQTALFPNQTTPHPNQTDMTFDTLPSNVFSTTRTLDAPQFSLPKSLKPNTRLKMDGLKFLGKLPNDTIPIAFLDPQYRGILDKMGYGNEGKSRGQARGALQQMPEEVISEFIGEIDRVLIPSGHLFLWLDKFHLATGFDEWLEGTALEIVDMVTWDKGRIGMGYRTRRVAEYCFVLQKYPRRAKGVWKIHTIPDVWREKITKKTHPHCKPVELQGQLIAAVSNEGDLVIDPAAGSFSVLDAAIDQDRVFLGCDLEG